MSISASLDTWSVSIHAVCLMGDVFVHTNGAVTMDFVALNRRMKVKDILNTEVWQRGV